VREAAASVTADHSSPRASSKRIVSARIVMPIIGGIELRDLLTQLIDALTAQGVITPEVADDRCAARTAALSWAEPPLLQATRQPSFLHGGFVFRRSRRGESGRQCFEVRSTGLLRCAFDRPVMLHDGTAEFR
jgi:hypothetical protein